MRTNILAVKSYDFALRIILNCREMISTQKEYVLSKQLLKSGTSIGAMIREAEFAQSKADFISKMSIALKESNETMYWISLLIDSGLIEVNKGKFLMNENNELTSMLIASIKTSKGR